MYCRIDSSIYYLKKERRSWPKQLDTLEQGIKQQNDELSELKVMYDDAQIARDTARAELSKLEQSVYEAKREREVQLTEYKKQAEEKKEHAEKVEKRVCLIGIINTDQLSFWKLCHLFFNIVEMIRRSLLKQTILKVQQGLVIEE